MAWHHGIIIIITYYYYYYLAECLRVSEAAQERSTLSVHTMMTRSQRLFIVVVYVTFRATYSIVVTFTVFALLVRHVNR